MKDDDFFKEQKLGSRIKTEIVTNYFNAWANVMIGHLKRSRFSQRHDNRRIAYIDLFAGPGIYKDGTESTPIFILKEAIKKTDLREMLVTIFNDSEQEYCEKLTTSIAAITDIDKLKHQPRVHNSVVDDSFVELFKSFNTVPTLFFVDPFGYKGLSIRLISTLIKDWGCDCIFFFSFNRINISLTNEKFINHMRALFGDDQYERVVKLVESESDSREREEIIMQTFENAIRNNVCKYVLKFRFKNEGGRRTSHYLVFISKNIRGYNIMKDIMAKRSSFLRDGEPSFECNPVWERGLFKFIEPDFSKPSKKLQEILLNDFAGHSISFSQILDVEEHHLNNHFVEKNYRAALIKLEDSNKITVTDPEGKNRRRGTFPPRLIITFPPR